MKIFGFTLTEALVTLTIIGVLGALTVPTLHQNINNQTYEMNIKKAYNTISTAIESYMVENSIINLELSPITQTQNALNIFVNTYFKTTGIGNEYFAHSINTLDKSEQFTIPETNEINAAFMLVDGSTMRIRRIVQENQQNENNEDEDINIPHSFTVEIDTNGSKGPNTSGRDVFTLDIAPDGSIINARRNNEAENSFNYYKNNSVIMPIELLLKNNWEMNY